MQMNPTDMFWTGVIVLEFVCAFLFVIWITRKM